MQTNVAYGVKDPGYCCTGDDGRPDDTVRCRQVVEKDSRATCQYRPVTSTALTNDDQMERRIRSTLDQYVRKPP